MELSDLTFEREYEVMEGLVDLYGTVIPAKSIIVYKSFAGFDPNTNTAFYNFDYHGRTVVISLEQFENILPFERLA